jgi:outer membrane immunogenic protein
VKKMLAALTVAAAWLNLISPLSAEYYGSAPCEYYGSAPCPPYWVPCACPSCPLSTFSGFYVGGNVGFVSSRFAYNDRDQMLVVSRIVANDTSWTAGVQVGYDWDFRCNCVILGLVADWNWSNAEPRVRLTPDAVNSDIKIETELRWLTTIRGRAGHVFGADAFLFYITGGAAYADFKASFHLSPPLASTRRVESFSKKRWGWTAGFGGEFALLCKWTLNAELLYMRFAKKNVTLANPGGVIPLSDVILHDNAWVGRLGLNYHFSWCRWLW